MLRTPRHTLFDYSAAEEKPQKLQPNGFAKLARFSYRNSNFIFLFWLAFIGLAAFFAVQKITGFEQQSFEFGAGSKPAENLQLLNKNFAHLESLVTITLSNPNSELLTQSRDVLVSAIENQKDQFELAFAPGTGEFYDRHAMLYHPKAEIEARVAYALSLRPLFSAIAQAPSTESLSTLVGEVSAAIKQGKDPQGLDDLFRQSALSLQALMQGTKLPVDWTAIAGLNVDPSPTSAIILVLPKPGQDKQAADFLVQNLNTLGKQTATQASLAVTSAERLAEPTSSVGNARVIQAVSMAVLLLIIGLASALGRAGLVAMFVVPVAAGIGCSILVAAFAQPSVTLALWPVFAGVGFAALVMSGRFAFATIEAMSESRTTETAIMLAAQKQGSGLIWQAAINIAVWAGFLALWGQGTVLISALATAGIFVALIASLTLIPATAKIFNSDLNWHAQAWLSPTYFALFGNRMWRATRTALTLAVLAAAGTGLFFVPQVLKNNNIESGSSQPVNILVSSIDEATSTLQKLKSIPEASGVRWLGAFLPQDVVAKQTALASLKDQFLRIGSLNAQSPDDLRDQIGLLQDSLTEIAGLPNTRPELRDAADEFRRSLALLSNTSSNAEIVEIENRLFGRFNTLADRSDFLASLENPNLESLDPRLKALFLSQYSVYRLEVSAIPGTSNAQLAEILYKNGLPVAHPDLVADLKNQSNVRTIIVVGTSAFVLGLVLLSLSMAEGAGIVSATLTVSIVLSIFGGMIGYLQLKLSPEIFLIGLTVLSLLFSIIATTFLKAEISERGAPAALHAIEAWLPAIIAITCSIPIFLFGIETAKFAAACFTIGSLLITAIIGFLLRPMTLFFRR